MAMRSRNGGRRRLGRNLRRDLWMLLSLLERQQRSCDGNGKDHVWLELNQFFGKGGQSILVATTRPINNIKVLIFYVTEFSHRRGSVRGSLHCVIATYFMSAGGH